MSAIRGSAVRARRTPSLSLAAGKSCQRFAATLALADTCKLDYQTLPVGVVSRHRAVKNSG
jgi:hypothetical protein